MAITLNDLLTLAPDEMLNHDETPSIESLGEREQVVFDDVETGMELPKYIHRYTTPEFIRWCITMENTHRLHYDYPHAINHDYLPGVLFHGSWRSSIITTWLKNWVLPDGWFWKASWQIREMVTAGETTILWGRVIGKQAVDGLGFVDVEFGIKNEDGNEGCPGKATVLLPIRGGKQIPYPLPVSTVKFLTGR